MLESGENTEAELKMLKAFLLGFCRNYIDEKPSFFPSENKLKLIAETLKAVCETNYDFPISTNSPDSISPEKQLLFFYCLIKGVEQYLNHPDLKRLEGDSFQPNFTKFITKYGINAAVKAKVEEKTTEENINILIQIVVDGLLKNSSGFVNDLKETVRKWLEPISKTSASKAFAYTR
jgi:hypothetical protein